MEKLNDVITAIDDFVWGPVMLILLVGTGIFLTIRTRFLTWRNLGYALKSTLSKEARTKSRGEGDVSPFSALTTALAATIGTGNIVGVATAMVSGGPGALVWMWISAAFGLTSKFSECMLAIKYREINAKGEMSGGPMYTMKKALKNKRFGAVLAWLFALFAVIASFGIGNMTQGNSISGALHTTFHVPTHLTGIVIGILIALLYRKTLFRGDAVPFVMELPNYRLPGLKNVMQLLWEKAKDFLQKAFTVIFVATICIWFLQKFDLHFNLVADSKDSILAMISNCLVPIFAPLGLGDWRICTSLISGVMAKESVISTLEILFGGAVKDALTPVAAASLLVFSLLYTPCIAAIASIRRELGRKWAVGMVIWQCMIAWVAAFAVRWLMVLFMR